MGRFSHEAMMVDPDTGYVYQTEDAGTPAASTGSCPNVHGRLDARRRSLHAEGANGQPNGDLGRVDPLGTTWDVEWVRIDDPLATTQSMFAQGSRRAARGSSRLEGAWWGDHTGYFLSTNGGPTAEGQVFEYDPLERDDQADLRLAELRRLDNPDNMTVTPRGGLLLCEDSAGGSAARRGERLIGLTLTATPSRSR